ncbi:MAG: radical SAM protein [Chloroflexi bacterium]|nr:radical SAM protein [Chloroflexota bacterium]
MDYKLCSLDCIYCQYGWTRVLIKDVSQNCGDFPSLVNFACSLDAALRKPGEINNITFSGNGEATLHPGFDNLVDIAVDLKQKLKPDAKLGILSNSTTVDNDKVCTALKKLDFRIMKLDAGTLDSFKRVNKPFKTVHFETVVEGLRRLGDIIIQTMFIEGAVQNTGNRELGEWIDKVKYINPVKIQIYSLDRPPADGSLLEVSKEELIEISEKTTKVTGIPVEVFVR